MDENAAERLLRETDDFKGAQHLVDVEGMSTARHCVFLNRLVAAMDPKECYLEIGTWKGRTLISAAHGNRGRRCIGCDKFRFWGRWTGWGHVARRALYANLARYRSECADIRFHEMPSRKLFGRGLVPSPVGVYFYDGDHTHSGTLHGVVACSRLLAPKSFLLMDDWNDPVIRHATMAGIRQAGLQVLWERVLEGEIGNPDGFSNGLAVFWLVSASAGTYRVNVSGP